MSNFDLKPPSGLNIFKSTDPKTSKFDIVEIGIANLHHFRNHPFELYKGERQNDMVQSIKLNGILMPLIVRPFENDSYKYEILSGHNRFESGKSAGLDSIPCIIKENLTDDEALLIVFETNLRQRSFSDFSHSQKASMLTIHYETVKKQGKRADMIAEIDDLLSIDEADKQKEFSRADKKAGEEYGLTRNMVAR